MDAWLYAVFDSEIWNYKIKYNIKTLNLFIWVILSWIHWSSSFSDLMLKTSVLSLFESWSLPCSCSSSWIFNTLDGYDSLKCSIINIQIIINLMMEFKIYIVSPSFWASSFSKYRRILSHLDFLTSLNS